MMATGGFTIAAGHHWAQTRFLRQQLRQTAVLAPRAPVTLFSWGRISILFPEVASLFLPRPFSALPSSVPSRPGNRIHSPKKWFASPVPRRSPAVAMGSGYAPSVDA